MLHNRRVRIPRAEGRVETTGEGGIGSIKELINDAFFEGGIRSNY